MAVVARSRFAISARALVTAVTVFSAIILDMRWGRVGGVRIELMVSLMLLAALPFIVPRRFNLGHFVNVTGLGLFYLGWIFLSALWSIDPQETMLQTAVFIIFVVLLLSQKQNDPDFMLDSIILAMVTLAVLSWLYLFIAGSAALSPKEVAWRLRGVLDHEQRLALYCGVGIIMLLIRRSETKTPYFWIYLLILVATAVATQARAFLGFTFAVTGLVLFFRFRSFRFLFALTWPIALASIYLLFPIVVSAFSRGEADFTLTGRTTIWRFALMQWSDAPFLGYGYGTFRTLATNMPIFQTYFPPHAHNTFLQSAVETGLIGTSFLCLWMTSTFVRGSTHTRFLIILAALAGLTGVVFGEKMQGVLIIILLVHNSTLSREYHTRR